MKIAIFGYLMAIVVSILYPSQGRAEIRGAPSNLPDWAATAVQSLASERSLTVLSRLRPSYLRGDFDGDGDRDYAFLVMDRVSGKQGLLLLLKGRRAMVIGAGKKFGNGGDDFNWLKKWRLKEVEGGGGSESLIIQDQNGVGGVVLFRDGRAKWQQMGD